MASRESPVARRQSIASRNPRRAASRQSRVSSRDNVMFRSLSSVLAIALLAAGCSRVPATPSSPAIAFNTSDPQHAFVEVTGLSAADRTALTAARLTSDEWSAVFRVVVKADGPGFAGDLPGVAGRYGVDDSVRFVPLFPLDPGRVVRSRVRSVTGRAHRDCPRARRARCCRAAAGPGESRSTVVTDVYPSGDVIPENQLRMVRAVFEADGAGQRVQPRRSVRQERGRARRRDAAARHRALERRPDGYTILFDPGRVEARHSPEPPDGAGAAQRRIGDACRQTELAGRSRTAAGIGVPEDSITWYQRSNGRSTPRNGEWPRRPRQRGIPSP